MSIIIEQYSQNWPTKFEAIKQVLLGTINGLPITIEHVGSTSVPGLAAKPILDIDIITDEQPDIFLEVKNRLQLLGYTHNGDQGITGREVFKYNRDQTSGTNDNPLLAAHHLYVCRQNNIALQNHLNFRDYLRSNATARQEYEAIKRKIAMENPDDMGRYVEQKTAFITSILEKTGITSKELENIIQQNKNQGK